MANPTLYSSGTQTAVITTEHILIAGSAAGTFVFEVDTSAMAANDVLELRVYVVTLTTGTYRVAYQMAYYGVQPTDDVSKISAPFGNDLAEAGAFKCTLKQTFGTGRAFPWKVLSYT